MIVWFWLVLLLCCSGLVSASETALFGVNRRTLQEFQHTPHALRRRVYRLMLDSRSVLMTVLIANTAVNVALFAASFIVLRDLRETDPALAAVGGVAVLIAVIIFGEIVPKTLALSNAVRVAPAAAALISVLKFILAPVSWVLRSLLVVPILRLITPASLQAHKITPEELSKLVEHSARDGVIDSREHEMLQAIVATGKVSVREIMTPRVDIVAAPIGSSRRALLQQMQGGAKRRILVYREDLDDIRGVVNARDLHLTPAAPITRLVKPLRFIPQQANLVQLLRHFRHEGVQLAVVVDEFGGTAGFVSIEHVIKYILGGMRVDESSINPETQRIDENTYGVSGNLSARLLAERFALPRIERHIDTVGGLILATLGRMPSVGDSVRIGNLTLTVDRMDKRRIEWIILRRDVDSESNEEQTS
ncbi:MAG: HlyC/CorC family transporter [Phycisphaerales bacterium]|nr:MAG: HlyC/CorC family transporter [Phycisphaerales bacterium]